MNNLLHWGNELNWVPIVFLAGITVLLFLSRVLTVWIFLKRLVVPATISSLYFLSGLALILITLWGIISTAWWMLLLGIICWYIVHIPFRKEMESWAQFQNTVMAIEDAETLLNKKLTPEQEETLKKRLGLND
jgi:hypothetical protein